MLCTVSSLVQQDPGVAVDLLFPTQPTGIRVIVMRDCHLIYFLK